MGRNDAIKAIKRDIRELNEVIKATRGSKTCAGYVRERAEQQIRLYYLGGRKTFPTVNVNGIKQPITFGLYD